MTLFVVLLWSGWTAVAFGGMAAGRATWWATVPLLAAILVRCGTIPSHCWLTD